MGRKMRGIIVITLSVSLLFYPATAKAQTTADSPVSLTTAQSFEAPLLSEVSHADIANTRREMASATAAEKFIDGVKTILIAALVVYLAWPDSGSSSSATFAPQSVPPPTAGGM